MKAPSNIEWIALLAQRLQKSLPGLPAQLAMAPSFRTVIPSTSGAMQAGVMLLLYELKENLHMVFIKRPEYEGVHSGQISFPGGKYEPADGTVVTTALRETSEEIGIPPHSVIVLGCLTPLYIPVSKINVNPVVGYLNEPHLFTINKFEVSYLIEVPIFHFLNPDIRGMMAHPLGMVPCFNVHKEQIWGATAMIMSEFIELFDQLNSCISLSIPQ